MYPIKTMRSGVFCAAMVLTVSCGGSGSAGDSGMAEVSASGQDVAHCEASVAIPFPEQAVVSLEAPDALLVLVDLRAAGEEADDPGSDETLRLAERARATIQRDFVGASSNREANVRLVIVHEYDQYNKPVLSNVTDVVAVRMKEADDCWAML